MPPPEADQTLGSTKQELIATGQRCLDNAQCKSGFCVDTVCCSTSCFFGARDDFSCSNVYGVVPGLVDGTCTHLNPTEPCGSLVSFNPCEWRGSNINGGGNCPAPNAGDPTHSCQPCGSSADCPAGLPVCINNSCTACTGDFGTGGAAACPTAAAPACVDSACVQCSATNTTACTGNTGSCDTTQNICVGCTGNYGSAPGPGNQFPCTAAEPACLFSGANAGKCVDCSSNTQGVPVVCSKDPTKTVCDLGSNTPPTQGICVNCVDSSTCPAATPVCTNQQCVQCNGNFSSSATSKCPTAAKPACIPSPSGPGTCAQCSASDSTACVGTATPVCDTTNDVCVECNTGTDCKDPAKPFCSSHICTSGCSDNTQCGGKTPVCNAGVCVGCVDNTTCSAPTPYCDVPSSTCVECQTSAECNTDPTKPVCSATGSCVPCGGNNGTASANACPTTTLPACIPTGQPNAGECVQCNASDTAVCTAAGQVCNLNTDTCVECVTSGDCHTTAKPVCDTSTSTCQPCNADNGTAGTPPTVLACPSALQPACAGGSCYDCKNDASGTNVTACKPGDPVCDNPTHTCVQCESNADCVGASGICNLSTHTCGPGCASDANCSSPTPRCKISADLCVQCLDFNDCSGATPQCDTNTNTCVQCVSNAQCTSPTAAFCSNGTCKGCNGDFGSGALRGCPTSANPVCLADGSCGPCSATNPGSCVAPTGSCNPATNTCVQCTTNAQCSGTTPICDSTGTCVPCNGDLNSGATHACFTAALPACDAAGKCVECTGTNSTACTSAKPACDTTNEVCVPCTSDAQCTVAPNSRCDTTSHTCTTGCGSNGDCSSSDPICNNGICVQCTATDSSHCTAPTPTCDTATSTCVGCTKTTDCTDPANPVCSSTTHTCTNSCTKDAECPGATPVCNPGTAKCVVCLNDSQCSAPTPKCNTTTNTCVVNPPPPDGGAPDAGADAGSPKDAGLDAAVPHDAGGSSSGGVIDAGYGGTSSSSSSGAVTPPPDVFSVEGGGCGCRTVPSSTGFDRRLLAGLGLAALFVVRRRRSPR